MSQEVPLSGSDPTSIENVTVQQNLYLKIFTGPPEFVPSNRKVTRNCLKDRHLFQMLLSAF